MMSWLGGSSVPDLDCRALPAGCDKREAMNLLAPVGDVGSFSVTAPLAWRGLDTGETLMLGVDQHHGYSMMSPGCRLVDPRVNVEGAAGWGRVLYQAVTGRGRMRIAEL